MYYYNSFCDDNNYIYSCDNLLLEFKCDIITLEKICRFCSANCDKYYTSFKTFSYKHCFTFDIVEGVSFTVLCGLNNYGKLKSVFVCDFNPNKCMNFIKFRKFMSFLFLYVQCSDYDISNLYNSQYNNYYNHKYKPHFDISIKRYDFAIDVPVCRDMINVVHLGKGARVHEVYETCSFSRTDYFGERSSVGRLKIYNKSYEDCKFNHNKYTRSDFDITRIELTHNSFDVASIYSSFPCVYQKNYDIVTVGSECNGIDYLCVCACRENRDYISYLKTSRSRWEKLKKYILDKTVVFDLNVIGRTLDFINSFRTIENYITSDFQNDFFQRTYFKDYNFDYDHDDFVFDDSDIPDDEKPF